MAERRAAVTLKDIAERTNVSKMTVSAVLGGLRSNVRVSEATRLRILETARQLDYRPNAVARSLRTRRTHIVGFYSGTRYLDIRYPFIIEILGGLHEGCYRNQEHLLLLGGFGRNAEAVYTEFASGRIDGLVAYVAPDDPLVRRMESSLIPVVVVVDAVPSLPSVVADEAQGGHLLVEHLAGLGHRRVLYGSCPRPLSSTIRRRDGFFEAARQKGMAVSEWVLDEAAEPAEAWRRPLHAWGDAPAAERATAVTCWNDLAAFDLLEQCRRLGIRVPGDLAIVGFDGLPTLAGTTHTLTTIRAPWAAVARTAVDLLVAHRGNGTELPAETVLPVELLVGDTT